MKNLFLFCVVCSFFLIGSVVNVFAADHDNCIVERIANVPAYANPDLNRSGVIVTLTCPNAFTNRGFYLSEDMGNAGLAILLTAVSLDNTVWVRIGSSTAPDTAGSIIPAIFVNKN